MSVVRRYSIYNKALESKIRELKFIPRQLNKNEHFHVFHKYWLPDFGVIKVNNVELIEGEEYYFIKYQNKSACISHPVNNYDTYELLHNYNSIENDNIINSDKSYSGAEIKFWFMMNNIDFSDDLYRGFWSFVNPMSKNVVIDTKFYYVSYDKSKKQQFQIYIDRKKNHH